MINTNKKSCQEKVLNNSKSEQVYNPEKYLIMNTRNPLL